MKSDPQPVKQWKRRRIRQETVLSGLAWRGYDGDPTRAISVRWTASASGLLAGVLQDAIGSCHDRGKNLPYASLRSVIEARVTGISVVRSDLAKPWAGGEQRPFLQAAGRDEDGSDVVRSVSHAVAQWASDVLFGWADRLGIETEKVDRIRTLGLEGRIVEATAATAVSIPPGAVNAQDNFAEVRDAIRTLLAEGLDGQELFEGLGSVHRVISSSTNGNAIEFETWPVAVRGGSFSMTCSLSVETLPWTAEPYVLVSAGKRVWMDRFPRPSELYGRKRITTRLMVRGDRRLSVAYEINLKAGIPEDNRIEDPAFLAAVLQNGVDLSGGIAEVAGRTSADGNHFIAVPYSTKFGRTRVPRGATAQDHLDLFKRVEAFTARLGFSPMSFEAVPTIGSPEEYHKALKAEMLLHHAASDLRLNDIRNDRITALFEEVLGEKPEKDLQSDALLPAGRLIETVRAANDERLARVFQDRVQVIFISRTSEEADLFTAATRSLFSTVDVTRYSLPPDVHGFFDSGKDRKRFAERFEDRVNAWKTLAETIAKSHPRARIIVQADKDYGGEGSRKREEDTVNKPAGRYALARFAGANVQYLLPMTKGGTSEYLIRLQAALYDLLFGHSGMAPVAAPAVKAAFPNSEGRPDAILGFSAIRKARLRRGGDAVSLLVASMLDVESGAVSARIATSSGSFPWMSFGDALVHVASLGATDIGDGREDEGAFFQNFVANTVESVTADGRKPLVLFDATSAQGLWPWLNNNKLTNLPAFGREQVANRDVWDNLTVVRVRTKATPRLLRLMHQENTACDTGEVIEDSHASVSIAAVRTVDGPGRGDYVTTRAWQRTQKIVRGTSAYRSMPGFRRALRGADGTMLYRQITHSPESNDAVIPESVGITVARTASGANPDSIAALVAALRSGYAHTAMETALPAPLSFRSKFEDYMSRHGLDAVDGEEEDADPPAVDEADTSALTSDPIVTEGGSSEIILDVDDAQPLAKLPTFGEIRNRFRAGDFSSAILYQAKDPLFMDHVKVASSGAGFTSILARSLTTSGSNSIQMVSDPQELIKPRLRVPDIATPEWFRPFMNMTRRDLREFHDKHSSMLRMVTGFPWPDQRPELDDFFGFLPEAARYPLFFRCFFVAMKQVRKDHMIKPLISQYRAEANRLQDIPDVANATPGPDELVEMVVAGARRDVAIAVVILDWSKNMNWGANGSRIATLIPELSDYMHDLMQCDPGGYDARLNELEEGTRGRMQEIEAEMDSGNTEHKTLESKQPTTSGEPTTDSLADVVNRWEGELLDLIDIATAARNSEPNAVSQQEVAAISNRLKDHIEAFERLRPKGVPTGTILDRMLKIARDLANIPEGNPGDAAAEVSSIEAVAASVPQKATSESLHEAEGLAGEAERNLSEALAARKEMDELVQRKLPTREYITLVSDVLDKLEWAVKSGFENVTKVLAALEPSVPPETGQGSGGQNGVTAHCVDVAAVAAAATPTIEGMSVATACNDDNVTDAGIPSVDIDEDDLAVIEDSPQIESLDRSRAELADKSNATEGVDHLLADVEKKSDELFIHGEFGLGYHLANSAQTVLGETAVLPYSADEMRLYALGSRLPGLSRVAPDGYHQAIEACAAMAIDLDEGDRADARRIALMASVLPTALLQISESGNAFNIIEAIRTTGRCSSFFYLVDLVRKNRSLSYPVTATSLRAASDANVDKSLANERRGAVLEQIKSIKSAQFRFVLGQKVMRSLVSKDGPVGLLETAINRGDVNFARTFSEKYPDRNAVTDMLDKETDKISSMQKIDGSARERLIAYITDLAARCAAYADSAGQADEIRSDGKRIEQVRDIAENMRRGIQNFEMETASSTGSVLVDAAYAHARKVLWRLAALIRGEHVPEIDRTTISLELHSPLLWLPRMAWSGAWTPSPNDAVRLISAICELNVPRIVGKPSEEAEAAIEARRREDAFVPAKMLLAFAPHFGIDAVRQEHLRALIETNEVTRKAQVRARHDDVSKLIAKVRRMALGGLEESTRLSEDLDKIKVESLSPEIPDFMPEEIEGFRVLDVNAAMSHLNDIERTARRLLDDAKRAFSIEISRLSEGSKITEEQKSQLLKLLDNDELATLTDWIQTFKSDQGRPTLTGAVMNGPLHNFNHVLKATTQIDLSEAQGCIENGATYGPFDFSKLDEARRQEAKKTIDAWIEFKRKLKNPRISQIAPHIPVLLSAIAYKAEFVDDNRQHSLEGRQIFVADVGMKLPSDPTSLMLPEFGSLTGGGWRVAAVGSTTTTTEIMRLAEGAEPRGTLVLMFGPMSADRRKQLKLDCVKNRRKVLVIDETLLLDYLATPDGTPLRMFEIAQAFSTATPYQDYARSQVPNEMFKGRAQEKAKIREPYGSYIVYGGRRLGKTALLRHISRNAPEHALFKFLDLNSFPVDLLWQYASEALNEIFPKSVNTPEEFTAGVKDYLQGDNRRRVLLMLDEADNFVRHEASQQHRNVVKLLNLMAETDHRFKFVLAGLHNVSRIIRSENSPLAQISNDPIRVGPLLQEDVGDAEILVRGPMSALGFEFANREDVWRILSFTNYYPVLIQVFCQGLLNSLEEQIRSGKMVGVIDGTMVDDAMRNPQIRRLLYEAFDKTITQIEQRYGLLTYIIAYDAYFESGQGLEGTGLSASEVTESAVKYWPQAFPKASDPSEIEYLLDEMEGFGILRRTTTSRKWTLRSRMLLDLMVSSEEDLMERLLSYDGKTIEQPFDPKNARRTLDNVVRGKTAASRISPLTDGQLSQIFSPSADDAKVMVIFGSSSAGIDDVVSAIEASRTYPSGEQRKAMLDIRGWGDRDSLASEIRRNPGGKKKLVVVPPQTSWRHDWVTAVARLPNVIRGDVRPIFVGGPDHAEAWAEAFRKSPSLSRIKVETLRPWARSFLATRLDAMNAIGSIDAVLQKTAGWSEPTQVVLASLHRGMKIDFAIENAMTASVKDGPGMIGIRERLATSFVTLARWCGESGVKVSDIKDILLDGQHDGIDPDDLVRFGWTVGVTSLSNASAAADHQLVAMDNFVRYVLLGGEGR